MMVFEQLIFEKAWAFWLLPLPWVISLFSDAYKTQRDALRVPFFKRLVALSGATPGEGALILQRNLMQKLGIAFAWVLVIVALADPKWLGDPIVKQQPARDLMLAVDLSGSMEAEDFRFDDAPPISRLDGVKQVLKEFVAQRTQDRIGLIVFGSAPYLQTPFTLDHPLFEQLLSEVQTRMAGPKTMLGDAIGLAVKHFASSDSRKKVLILLTDGNDSGSLVPPVEAARVALDEGVIIHTIAVGDPSATGEQELDLESLQRISAISGGVFFRATSGNQLSAIYNELNRLETQDIDVTSFRPKQSLFHWPIGIMLVMQLSLQTALAISSWASARKQLKQLQARSTAGQQS